MSAIYYRFYKNLIQNQVFTLKEITDKINDAYAKGRLNSKEKDDLFEFIGSLFAEE